MREMTRKEVIAKLSQIDRGVNAYNGNDPNIRYLIDMSKEEPLNTLSNETLYNLYHAFFGEEISLSDHTYFFYAYKNQEDYESNNPYFTKSFNEHSALKVFSASHSFAEKQKYPNYLSRYEQNNPKD